MSEENKNGSRVQWQFADNILGFDLFRSPFSFVFPDGFASISTKTGVFASYLLLLIVVA